MPLQPEDELMVLLECAEGAWTMGRVEDFLWHAEQPGKDAFVEFIVDCERRGWVTFEQVHDPDTGRLNMHAQLTRDGNGRLAELNAAGVKPSKAVDADDDVL
jgi:hypothetical protein